MNNNTKKIKISFFILFLQISIFFYAMPKRRRSTRSRRSFRFRGRRFRRSIRRGKRAFKVSRKMYKGNLMPDEYFCKLNLVHSVAVVMPNGGTRTAYAIKGNSLYQPAYDVAANAGVIGVTKFANFYGKVKVLGSKIKVLFQPTIAPQISGTAIIGNKQLTGICILVPVNTEDITVPTDTINQVLEQRYVRWKTFGLTTSTQTLMLKHYLPTKKIFAKRNIEEEDFGSLTKTTDQGVTGDPVNTFNWVFAINTNQAASGALEMGQIWSKTTYYVKFYKKKVTDV